VTWPVVAAVAVVCVLLRVAAPLALRGRSLPPALERRLDWAVAPLLAALVAVQLAGDTPHPGLDARAPGLAAAALVYVLRRSTIGALAAAVAVTAAFRAAG
jgi:branched-subunit amino acid transport protein